MKNILKVWVRAGIVLSLLCGCDERTPDLYSAPDGIYFNNRTAGNVLTDTTSVTFVYEADDVEYMDVPVAVQTIGRQTGADRPVNLRVWSDNAVEGEDYELLTPAVVPAFTSSFSYVVRLKRTVAIRTRMKSVYLKLSPNEYFTTFLAVDSTSGKSGRYTEMLEYRIDFSDFYSAPPLGWRPEYVGEFSERKLRLMWKLFDKVVDRADYNVAGAIPFNRWVYMKNEIEKYMYEQEARLKGWSAGEVDEDALVDPEATGDSRQLLDFTPIVSD